MTSYFLFYLKKGLYLVTYFLSSLAFFYYASITGIVIFFLIIFSFIIFYYFYSKSAVIKIFKASLIQGIDPFFLKKKVLKISKMLNISPPNIYVSQVDFFLLTTYSISKNNRQLFISEKLLNDSTPSLLEAYLTLGLSHIKTKGSYKSSIAYCITSIFLNITNQLDSLFSVIFGIHVDRKYIYRSPFSSLMSLFLYSFNFLFLTESTTEKSDKLSTVYCDTYSIEKALWNLQYYSVNIDYPLTLSSSILCILNPLAKEHWFKYLNYQYRIKNRLLNINGNYPIF